MLPLASLVMVHWPRGRPPGGGIPSVTASSAMVSPALSEQRVPGRGLRAMPVQQVLVAGGHGRELRQGYLIGDACPAVVREPVPAGFGGQVSHGARRLARGARRPPLSVN